jgi:hypothetical protein
MSGCRFGHATDMQIFIPTLKTTSLITKHQVVSLTMPYLVSVTAPQVMPCLYTWQRDAAQLHNTQESAVAPSAWCQHGLALADHQ